MHTRTIAALMLTACTASSKPRSVQSANDQPLAASNAPATDAKKTATLADVIGKGLQSAQDQAQAAGFYSLTSHDVLGRGRMQPFDRIGKVCWQTRTPGEHPTGTKVDATTVTLEETCPAADEGALPQAAGSTMSDFTGKSVKVARQALDSSTSSTVASCPARQQKGMTS
ncbi:hypothetical protein OH769_11500 [[Kitasatospora] papulosa]|uniref:hypothetical protein n=1 Tax=[Kitasatospora] papulosa TaxID=1464011 RepID=UPI003869E03D